MHSAVLVVCACVRRRRLLLSRAVGARDSANIAQICAVRPFLDPLPCSADTVQCFVSTTEVVCDWEIGTRPAFDSGRETVLYAERK